MSDFLKYKGYLGSVGYSADDNCLFGKVMFIKSLLMYEGETLQELETMFHQVIDEYLEQCQADGIKPNVPCSGVLNLRLEHNRHLAVAEQANRLGISINDLICSAIDKRLNQESLSKSSTLQNI